MADPLTVVIPAHKAERTLAGTLSSVRAQHGVSPRIVVVLDGQNDLLTEIAQSFGVEEIVVHETPLGSQRARNRGLAQADTEFVTFLDSDDMLAPDTSKAMLDRLNAAQADVCFCPWQPVDAAGKSAGHKRLPELPLESAADVERFVIEWAGGRVSKTGAMTWRTAALRAAGGWNEDMLRYQDVEIGFRSIASGLKPVATEEGCLYYTTHDSATRVSAQSMLGSLPGLNDYFMRVLDCPTSSQAARQRLNQHVGQSLYRQATRLYSEGADPEADEFLARARQLGFNGHIGRLPLRTLASLFGLRRALKIRAMLMRYRS